MTASESFDVHRGRGIGRNLRIALLVLCLIGVLAIVAGMEAFKVTESAVDYQTALEQSIEQRRQVRIVASMIQDAETSQRGYLLTSDIDDLRHFESLREKLAPPLDALVDALSGNAAQVARAMRLRELAATRMRQLSDVLAETRLAEPGPAARSEAIIDPSRANAAKHTRAMIRRLLEDMIAVEETDVRDASRALNGRIRSSRTVTIALIGSIVALVAFVVTLGLVYLAHRARIESELRVAMVGAREASEAKTQFLASMSHEIRTPLTGILGYTELLLDERLDSQQRAYVEHLQAAGVGLSVLVDDILELSKIEAGEVAIVEVPLSPGALVANVLSIVSPSAQKKQLELRSDIDPALPESVLGDEPRLRQVLLNLLTNAIKFTREGAVTVRVMYQGPSDDRELLRFEVSDTGIGIAADRQSRLFRRFSQADASIQHEYGGTGLGLAISKRLVDLMGGTIGFESEEGQGSTFWFQVALAKSDAPADAIAANAETKAALVGRILLVEDSPQNQGLVCAILKREGHQIDIANNGEEAIAAVQSDRYDLILMDIQMPRMDGVTATRKIRAMDGPTAHVPIIAMTANVMREQLTSFRKAGLDGHIAKPFRKASLIEAVDRWLSREGTAMDRRTHESQEPAAHDPVAPGDMRELMGDAWIEACLVRLKGNMAVLLGSTPDTLPDSDGLKQQAHRIAADAGQLGFPELSRRCRELEEACVRGDDLSAPLERARQAGRFAEAAIDGLLHAAPGR